MMMMNCMFTWLGDLEVNLQIKFEECSLTDFYKQVL